MSRKTPIKELIKEDSITGSPCRRSTRIAAVVTRRASASEEPTTPAKITRTKRLSLSQDSTSTTYDDDKASQSSKGSSHGRTTPSKLQIVTRGASKSPQSKAKATETLDTPARRTRSRGSTSSIADEEDRVASLTPARVTRRSSARFGSVSPTSEPATVKAATPRKSTRGASASPTREIPAAKPAVSKLKGRRSSVTDKVVPLESIEEAELKLETESTEATSENEVKTQNASEHDLKKKKGIIKQNLHTIAETSFTEESQDLFNTEKQDQVTEEKKEEQIVEDVNKSPKKAEVKESPKAEPSPSKAQETKPKSRLSLIKSKDTPEELDEEKELKLVLNTDAGEQYPLRRSPRKSLNLSVSETTELPEQDSAAANKSIESINTDVINDTNSDESFRLNLQISESDVSQENIEPKTNGISNLNTSGSSNASDKENLSKLKITETKPSPKVTDSTKKKWLSEFNAQVALNNSGTKDSPAKPTVNETDKTKSKMSENSFCEPMEVDDYPSDCESNTQADETSPQKGTLEKSKEKLESPKTASPSPAKEKSETVDEAKSPSLLRKSFKLPEKDSPVAKKPSETSEVRKSINLSENDILKIDISSESVDLEKPKIYSVTTESPKLGSPVRRSARLLKQHEESPVSEKASTPKSRLDSGAEESDSSHKETSIDTKKKKESKSEVEETDSLQIMETSMDSKKKGESKSGAEEFDTSPIKQTSADSNKKRESVKSKDDINQDHNRSISEELSSESKQVEDNMKTKSNEEIINISLKTTTEKDDSQTQIGTNSLEEEKPNEDSMPKKRVPNDNVQEKSNSPNKSKIINIESDNEEDSSPQKKRKKQAKSKRSKSGSSESSSPSKDTKAELKNSFKSSTDDDRDDLSQKINKLIENQLMNEDSSSEESVIDYLDDMAEEGEEDTPSEGSNDIIDEGESIGSTESEIDSNESYELDSFIDDDEENDLLSGEEYDLGQEKKPKKRLRSRIIQLDDSDDEEDAKNENTKENQKNEEVEKEKDTSLSKKPTPVKGNKSTPDKMRNGLEEDSDLEKMSTQPYCGLTPPSVVSVRDSLSDNEDVKADLKDEEDSIVSVLINQEDNLKSLEELKEQRLSDKFEKPVIAKTPQASTSALPSVSTPNNSFLESETDKSESSSRKRLSSLTIQENISLKDIQEGNISDRISKVVDVFCSSVKKDSKSPSGNISLNISLDYVKSPSPAEDELQQDAESEKVEMVSEVQEQLAEEQTKKKKKRKSITIEAVVEPAHELQNLLEEHLNARKRLSQEHQQVKIVMSGKEEKPINVLDISTRNKASVDLENQAEGSSKKARKKKKHLSASANEEAKENSSSVSLEKTPSKKKEKKTKDSILQVVDVSDSEMSEDLDKGFNEKYSSNTSNEFVDSGANKRSTDLSGEAPSTSSKKAKKKKKSKKLDQGPALVEVKPDNFSYIEKKMKKNKKLKDDQNSEPQEDANLLKIKKKKHKLAETTEPVIPTKKVKQSKIPSESGGLSDEVFIEKEPQKKEKISKKSKQADELLATPYPTKLKKKRTPDMPSVTLFKPQKSTIDYFPSSTLQQLTKIEKQKDAPSNTGKPARKPKLVPSSSMGKRSWDSDVIDLPVKPSTSSTLPKAKKLKSDYASNFSKKDFKNRILYDSARVARVDTETLLKEKKKMKL